MGKGIDVWKRCCASFGTCMECIQSKLDEVKMANTFATKN